MKKKDIIYRLASEYVSKIDFCDACFCTTYCTLKGIRESRQPCKDQEKCIMAIADYLKKY